MTSRFVAEASALGVVIDDPSTWSAANLFRLIFYVIALGMQLLEQLFDQLKLDIDEEIAKLKPHSLRWYAEKAKAFRYGYDLLSESDAYDDTGLTEQDIEAAQIVKHAAVVEQQISASRFGLRLKVATENADELVALSAAELEAFEEYMARVKDAGVPLLITSGNADSLRLTIDIYYNPLVLNANGQRIDGTDMEPVQTAIKTYLKNLPFNGVLVLERLEDAIDSVSGVINHRMAEAKARYGALAYQTISVKYIPDAGYLRLIDVDALQLNFIAESQAG